MRVGKSLRVGETELTEDIARILAEVATYASCQHQRLLVKQGSICYWQTRLDHNFITFDERFEFDPFYIRKHSLWTHFKLTVQTVDCVLTTWRN